MFKTIYMKNPYIIHKCVLIETKKSSTGKGFDDSSS